MGWVRKKLRQVDDAIIQPVVNVVKTAADFVLDKVVVPVLNTVSNVVQAALDDPIKTIATIAAYATGNVWAIPLIEAADVAIAGGDIGDVLEAGAKAYVAQSVGSYVGKAAGSYAGQIATSAGAEAATSKLAEQIVGAGAKSATTAVVYGKDPLQAFVTGGVSAAVPAVLGKVEGFSKLPVAAQNTISAAIGAKLSGGNVTQAVVASAVAATDIVTKTLEAFDPSVDASGKAIPDAQRKLTPEQRAIAADVLMGSATAAVTGGSISDAAKAAMIKGGTTALGNMITSGFKTATDSIKTAFTSVSISGDKLAANEAAQQTAVTNYNNAANAWSAKVAEQNRLLGLANAAKAELDRNPTQAVADAANAAIKTYNAYVTQINSEYASTYRPLLDTYGTQLDTLKQQHAVLVGDYDAAMDAFATKTNTLTEKLDPIYFTSNRAFVEAMDPNFNAEEYRKLNGLAATDDPYEHYLGVGQFNSAPTNLKAAEPALAAERSRIVTSVMNAYEQSKAPLPTEKAILDLLKSKYGDDVSALRKVTADTIKPAVDGVLTIPDNVQKIDITLHRYGAWRTPPADEFTAPAGVKLATKEEMRDGTAQMLRTRSGDVVFVVPDAATAPQFWNPATGTYERVQQATTAPKVTTAEQIKAYGSDPTTWQGAISDALLNASKTIVGWAKDTGNSTLINSAANVVKAGGGFLESINGISVLWGTAPKNTKLGQFADALQNLGKASNTAEYQAAINGMKTMIGDAKGVGGTIKAIYGAFKSAPLEFLAEYVGVEGIQEVAPLLIGGVATSGAKGAALALKYGEAVAARIGSTAGMTTAILTDITESAGGAASGAYTEAYNLAKKQGKSDTEADKIAMDIAQRSALVSGVTTAASMGLYGSAVEKALLGRTGTGLGDAIQSLGDFAKAGTKITLKEGVSEGGEEGINQAFLETQLYKLDPTRDIAGNITQAAAFGMIAGGPIAGTAYASSQAGDVISNALMGNALVADTVTNSTSAAAATTALKNLGITSPVYTANLLNTKYDADYTSSQEAYDALASRADYIPNSEDVTALTGATKDSVLGAKVEEYVDPRVFDLAEVKAAAAAEGYTLTDAEAAALVGQKDEATATTAARAQFDSKATNSTEAAEFFKTTGYTPTAAEINQFVGSKTEAAQSAAVAAYVNPKQVTFTEAKKYLTDLGYNPTDAEVNTFVGQVNEAEQATKIAAYADPRVVDEQEVRDAYAALGLKAPTTEDIKLLMGQYAETDLAAKAKANLDPARYNSIVKQLEELATKTGTDPAVLDTIKQDLNKQITTLGGDITKLSGEVATIKGDLTKAIADAQKGDTARFDAIDKAVADLRAAGLTETQVQKIVSDGLKPVADKLATVEAAVGKQVNAPTVADSQQALKIVTGLAAYDAKYDWDGDGKVTMSDGIALLKAANGDTSVYASQKKDGAWGQPTGVYKAVLDAQTSLQASLADAQKGNTARFDGIDKAITDLKAAGLTEAQVQAIVDKSSTGLSTDFKTALAEAAKGNTAALNDVKSGLESKISDVQSALEKSLSGQSDAFNAKVKELMNQGATFKEATETAIAGLGTDIANLDAGFSQKLVDVQSAIETAMGEQSGAFDAKIKQLMDQGATYKEAFDTALGDLGGRIDTLGDDFIQKLVDVQSAMETALGDQSTAFNERFDALRAEGKGYQEATQAALQGLGLDIATLGEDFNTRFNDLSTSLGTQISDLSTKIGDVESSLAAAIADAKKAGLDGDAALQVAIGNVAADLGTTKADLLKQIGATEEALRADFKVELADVESNLAAAIADAKKAGLEGDAALQSALDAVSADLGTTKLDLLTKIGATEDALRSDFKVELTNVQDSLSAAIEAAKQAGLEGDAALQAALDTVSADLGTTKTDLLDRIGTSETALRTEFSEQIGAVQSQVEAVQKSIMDQMAEYEKIGLDRDTALSLAINTVASDLGTTKNDLLAQIGSSEAALQSQITALSADLQAKYDSLSAGQKALADQLMQQGADLNTAINTAKAEITADVQAKYDSLTAEQKALADSLAKQGLDLNTAINTASQQAAESIASTEQRIAQLIGKPAQNVTQSDLDALISNLEQQGAYDPTLDYNGDRVIDQKDKVAIEQRLSYNPDTDTPFAFNPAAGSRWAPTGIYAQLAADQAATQKAIADANAASQAQAAAQAEASRQAAARNSANLARLGNVNTMMQMLSQAPDLGGQQVTVKAPDPAKIGYIYDWSSIFANPAQQQMFVTPYAKGGAVDVDEELRNLLRG